MLMQQFSLLNSNKFNVVPFLKSKHMHHEKPISGSCFPNRKLLSTMEPPGTHRTRGWLCICRSPGWGWLGQDSWVSSYIWAPEAKATTRGMTRLALCSEYRERTSLWVDAAALQMKREMEKISALLYGTRFRKIYMHVVCRKPVENFK